jgi:acyl-CoA thioesterase-1
MDHRFVLSLLASLLVVSLSSGCVSPANGRADLVYLALGASDAVGIGAIPLTRGYVFRVREALIDRGLAMELVNLGIPGAEIDDIRRVGLLSLAVRPGLVTLWTGANDLINGADVDDFEDVLEDLLEQLRDSTNAHIVIGDLPDLTRIPRFLDDPSRAVTTARVRAFNEAIERQAERFDVPVARLSQIGMLDEITSDIDGFHPNNRGHQMIAEQFLTRIGERDLARSDS